MKSLRAVSLFLCAWVLCFAAARAQELDLVGDTSWHKSGNGIRIFAERIENNRAAGTSGFLRLQIWATTNVYDGVSDITGYVLGTFNLDVLPVEFIFANASRVVRYNKPPPGLYYTTITLEENTTEGFVIADSENFEGLVNLGGFGQGSDFFENGNGDVSFVGDISWLAGNGRVNLFAEQILNERTTRTGNLRVRLWATSAPYQGEDVLQGYPLATKRVGRLSPESFIPNFSRTTSFRPPPIGEYYVTMTLEEYFHGWNIVDYVTFEGTSIF
jgi:hypothetical protein